MKNFVKYSIPSTVLVASALLTTTASAAAENPYDKEVTLAANVLQQKIDEAKNNINSTIVLNTVNGPEEIKLDEAGKTISEIFKEKDIDVNKYYNSRNIPVNGDYTIKDGDSISLYQSSSNPQSKIVDLKIPVKEVKTDTLYKGETKIKENGKVGKALKTTITTTANNTIKSVEENLTVLEPSVERIVLKGTKERISNVVGSNVVGSNEGSSLSRFNDTNSITDSIRNGIYETLTNGISQDTIDLILAQVGKPYVWGATGPSSFDCSGLVQWIFRDHLGKNIPRVAADQGAYSTPVSLENIQPGDIFWNSGHIGIYIGNNKVVHAANENQGVILSSTDWFIQSGFNIGRL